MRKGLILAICLLPALLAGGTYRFAREYAFSDSAKSCRVEWRAAEEPDVEAWVYMHSYSFSPDLSWSSFSTMDTSMVFQRTVTGDSALFYVVPVDTNGNRGEPSDTVKVAYRRGAPAPEPPPDTTKSDAPLAQDFRTSTSGWKISGPVGVYSRSYDYGTGLYFFERLGPYPQYDCSISRTLRLRAGRYTVTLVAGTGGQDCPLVTTLGTETSATTIQKKKNYADTLGNQIEMNFQIQQAGTFVLKFDPQLDACFKRWQIVPAGGAIDVTPPAKFKGLKARN